MPAISVARSARIPAPAALVYDIIADYRDGPPRILPPAWFGPLEVEAGGRGAGSRIRFEMRAYGRVTLNQGDITEPDPGRELRETLDSGIVTTFLLEPMGPAATRVTIQTDYRKPGVPGWLESLLVPRYLRRVYGAELDLLQREAARRQRAT